MEVTEISKIQNYGGTNPFDLPKIIEYLEATPENSWCTDVVKTRDGKNCLLGHLFDYGGNHVMDAFEETVATTYMFYPVNDGTHPDYPQPTPKQRILQYLKDIISGKQKSVAVICEEEFQKYKAKNDSN